MMNSARTDKFDAQNELAEIRAARKVRRKRSTWGRSRLTKYRAELIKLKAIGASYEDMKFWLRKKKRVKVDKSTIWRFLVREN